MHLTEQEKQDYISEALDSSKVNLYCKTHTYFGPSKLKPMPPTKGCAQCWMVFYFHDLATTAPHQRAQRLEELTEVLHNVVQHVEKGTWDLVINPHAKIEIESN